MNTFLLVNTEGVFKVTPLDLPEADIKDGLAGKKRSFVYLRDGQCLVLRTEDAVQKEAA